MQRKEVDKKKTFFETFLDEFRNFQKYGLKPRYPVPLDTALTRAGHEGYALIGFKPNKGSFDILSISKIGTSVWV